MILFAASLSHCGAANPLSNILHSLEITVVNVLRGNFSVFVSIRAIIFVFIYVRE